MTIKCAVVGCRTEGKGKGFHAFPSNKEVASKWINATKAYELIDRFNDNKLSRSWYKVCNKHFKESDYETNPNGDRRLLKGVIPSLLLPSQTKIEHSYTLVNETLVFVSLF